MKKLNDQGYRIISNFEGLKLKAYQCSAGKWTIGFGNTFFPDGTAVTKGDVITKEYAQEMFNYTADKFASKVDKLVTSDISQNQFNSLVSIAYNIGVTAFSNSTLLRLVNINPNDGNIAKEFLKWVRAGGKVNQGLTNRRISESSMYFSDL